MASPARVIVFRPLPRNLVLIETVELPPRTPRPPPSDRPPKLDEAKPRSHPESNDAPRTPRVVLAFIAAIFLSMAIVMRVFGAW